MRKMKVVVATQRDNVWFSTNIHLTSADESSLYDFTSRVLLSDPNVCFMAFKDDLEVKVVEVKATMESTAIAILAVEYYAKGYRCLLKGYNKLCQK